MTNVYDQHRTAFAQVEAYIVMKDGERVATIAFKFPRDGAGRLQAYVHWIGLEMVRGTASGGGYDKRTAACSHAMPGLPGSFGGTPLDDFKMALHADRGPTWDNALRAAGFTVLQAV